jgi:ketosteroid isomerase-like protein
MRGTLTLAAALAATLITPAAAQDEADVAKPVIAAADAFFAALRSPDKTALRTTMLDEAVIFIHDRRDPEAPKMRIVASGDHLDGWEKTPPGTDEYMRYDHVQVDGRMGHIWGPYVFLLNGQPTHCGINSMSFAKTKDGWRVANTSFTMTALDECEPLGAPEVPSK